MHAIVRLISLAGLLALAALLTGCPNDEKTPASSTSEIDTTMNASGDPLPGTTSRPTTAPRDFEARNTPPDDPKVARFLGLVADKPATWKWHPPENIMRVANYVVPADSGGDQAHLVIFDTGGGLEANIARWVSQFRTPDHYKVEPDITKLEVSGMPVTVVELAGEYAMNPRDPYRRDYRMIIAYIERPEGDVQIRLTGNDATVASHRETFLDIIRSIRIEG